MRGSFSSAGFTEVLVVARKLSNSTADNRPPQRPTDSGLEPTDRQLVVHRSVFLSQALSNARPVEIAMVSCLLASIY